jgi:hypothetical protein
LETREGHTDFKVHDLACVHGDTLEVVGFEFEAVKGRLDIFLGDGGELGTEYALPLTVRDVVPADVQDLETDVLALLVTVQPQNYKVYASRHCLEVLGDYAGLPIKFPDSRGIKQTDGVGSSILVLQREVSIVHMTRH